MSDHPTVPITAEVSAAADHPPAALPRGTHAGRYLILEVLGQGGMGVVYSAYDPDLDRKVALKLLLPSQSDAAEFHARLLREAQAMARLSHPHVVAVYDAGLLDGRLFIAMEMVEGQTLARWLRAERRPWQQIRDVFVDAARGLHAAHQKGLVHRDFKPGNVLVSAAQRVCVTDFGLARSAEVLGAAGSATLDAGSSFDELAAEPGSRLSPRSDSLTRTGLVLGTPAYMAPEQISGRAVDARSDQYAFCVSLYEALYGGRPELSPQAARELSPPRLPAPVRDGGPGWLRRAVLKGLSSRPSDRFASMEELIEAIARSPYRRAQQALVAVGLTAVVASALGLALWMQGAAGRRCDATAAREELWGASKRAQVSAAILATQKPWAPAAWRGVQKSLDDYASAWASAQTDACLMSALATRDKAASSPRLDCLAERKEELAAMVALLAGSTAETVEKTTGAVQLLTPLEGCARAELTSPRQLDPKTAAARAALRPKLARAKALYDAGQYQAALTAARDALDMAKAANDPALGADALYALGMVLDKTGDVEGARRTLLEAALQADAHHRDDTAARAYAWLLFVTGYELQRREQAAREEQHARAAITRLGGSPELEGNLENAIGAMYRAINDNAQAREHYQKAIALLESVFGADSTRVAGPLNNLSSALVALDRFDEAEAIMKRSMEIRVKALGEGHPSIGPVYNNMAELAARRGQWDRALELFEKAQRQIETGQGVDHPFVMIAMNGRGTVLTQVGRFTEALALHQQTLEKRTRVHGEKHPWLAYDLTGIGRAKLGLGDAAGAAEALEKAMALREGSKGHDPRDVAETKFALAKALAALGRDPQRARQLAAEADEAFRRDGRRLGSIDEAREWLAQAGRPP